MNPLSGLGPYAIEGLSNFHTKGVSSKDRRKLFTTLLDIWQILLRQKRTRSVIIRERLHFKEFCEPEVVIACATHQRAFPAYLQCPNLGSTAKPGDCRSSGDHFPANREYLLARVSTLQRLLDHFEIIIGLLTKPIAFDLEIVV